MPHEKQGAITLLDEEARFEDKGKFASASTHLSSVKDILAVSQWQEKIQNGGSNLWLRRASKKDDSSAIQA